MLACVYQVSADSAHLFGIPGSSPSPFTMPAAKQIKDKPSDCQNVEQKTTKDDKCVKFPNKEILIKKHDDAFSLGNKYLKTFVKSVSPAKNCSVKNQKNIKKVSFSKIPYLNVKSGVKVDKNEEEIDINQNITKSKSGNNHRLKSEQYKKCGEIRSSQKRHPIVNHMGLDSSGNPSAGKYRVDADELPKVHCSPQSTNKSDKQPLVNASDVNGGGEANLQELRTMALRQRAQLDTQRAQLAAKEQRLRALVAAHGEHERLRRLRERVDAQELKLRRLRALRGQVDANRQINAQLTSDLDSIRALFNEKEKELSLAVAKVDELTRQLDCVRGGGRTSQQAPSAAALELDKLRRELMYRNKLNEQQNARLHQQREALTQRQEEVSSIDRRIGELQERLHRKRLLNQRLANQINATSHKAGQHKLVGLDNNQHGLTKQHSRGNIAAVEPYNHIPSSVDGQNNFHVTSNQLNQNDYNNLKNNKDDASVTKNNLKVVTSTGLVKNDNDYITEFTASKSDPKYQTLPYNTKFSVNFVSTTKKRESTASEDKQTSETDSAQQNQTNQKQQAYQQHMTVHSTPLSTINKSLAVALNQNENTYQEKTQKNQQTDLKIGPNNVEQGYQQNALQNITRSQPIGAPLSSATTLHNTTPNNYQKPISSVAPTSVQHTNKHSAIYQTSSTKIQPVQPQTIHPGLTNSPSNIANNNNSQANVINTQTNPYYSASSVPTSAQNNPPNSNVANVPSYITSNNIPPNFNNYPNQGTPNSSSPYFDNIPVPSNSTNTQTSASNFSNNPPPCLNNSPSAFPNFTQPDATDAATNTNQTDTVPSPCKPILPPKPAIKPPPRQMGQIGFETSENSEQSKESTVKIVGYESKADKRPEKMVYDNKPIKAKPLTIKKQPLGEQPRLKSAAKVNGVHVSINRRIEMPPAFLFPEMSASSADYGTKSDSKSNGNKAEQNQSKNASADDIDKKEEEDSKGSEDKDEKDNSSDSSSDKMVMANVNENNIVRRANKGNLKQNGKANLSRRVSFDPLALLLDASLEGELELVARTASQVSNASAANDEGITALHNAICAGHLDIVRFLVDFGCDVNAQDSDGWTPLHCAASCNSLPMVRFLVEHGACIFATTLSDHETAAEKCEEDEEGFDGCSEYLYSVQEKLGILSGGAVYAVFDYAAQQQDELSFAMGERLTVLRKGDESEREWWWARLGDKEGYIPRNLLGLYPRVTPKSE